MSKEQEIKGRIEAISFTNKAIKLDNGVWYKANSNTEKFAMGMNKGDIVKIRYTIDENSRFRDNIISFITKSKSNPEQQPVGNSEEGKKDYTSATVLALMKVGATIFTVVHQKPDITFDKVMTSVVAEYRRLMQDFRENGQ